MKAITPGVMFNRNLPSLLYLKPNKEQPVVKARASILCRKQKKRKISKLYSYKQKNHLSGWFFCFKQNKLIRCYFYYQSKISILAKALFLIATHLSFPMLL